MDNNSSKYNFEAFKNINEYEGFSFNEGKLYYENETHFHILGALMILWGIGFVFWHPIDLSEYIWIIIELILTGLGFLIVKKLGSFIVLDTTKNALYKEYRIGKFVFFKWRLVKLEDVIRFGLTHKVGHPINFGKGLSNLFFGIYFKLLNLERYLYVKPFDPKYGGIEETALIYLTKNGRIGRITKFSYLYVYDTNYDILGSLLRDYSKIPFIRAWEFRALSREKDKNGYRFTTYELNPLIFSEDFMKFIICLSLMLSTIGFIALLFYFNII